MSTRPQKQQLQDLEVKRIFMTHDQIEHARKVTACLSKDADDAKNLLEHLGLMPGQEGWFEYEQEK